jgi:hypothetical protein
LPNIDDSPAMPHAATPIVTVAIAKAWKIFFMRPP